MESHQSRICDLSRLLEITKDNRHLAADTIDLVIYTIHLTTLNHWLTIRDVFRNFSKGCELLTRAKFYSCIPLHSARTIFGPHSSSISHLLQIMRMKLLKIGCKQYERVSTRTPPPPVNTSLAIMYIKLYVYESK